MSTTLAPEKPKWDNLSLRTKERPPRIEPGTAREHTEGTVAIVTLLFGFEGRDRDVLLNVLFDQVPSVDVRIIGVDNSEEFDSAVAREVARLWQAYNRSDCTRVVVARQPENLRRSLREDGMVEVAMELVDALDGQILQHVECGTTELLEDYRLRKLNQTAEIIIPRAVKEERRALRDCLHTQEGSSGSTLVMPLASFGPSSSVVNSDTLYDASFPSIPGVFLTPQPMPVFLAFGVYPQPTTDGRRALAVPMIFKSHDRDIERTVYWNSIPISWLDFTDVVKEGDPARVAWKRVVSQCKDLSLNEAVTFTGLYEPKAKFLGDDSDSARIASTLGNEPHLLAHTPSCWVEMQRNH
ncbi:hypothetical protein BKA62DRAFT_772537 [Auriculariales sp. MPI-PUGE-AT-0066]|nr:hypothetical protein BKA62DRAFT_772537 [Auriculariales sp. MPI-PUGE-AT-0066]